MDILQTAIDRVATVLFEEDMYEDHETAAEAATDSHESLIVDEFKSMVEDEIITQEQADYWSNTSNWYKDQLD